MTEMSVIITKTVISLNINTATLASSLLAHSNSCTLYCTVGTSVYCSNRMTILAGRDCKTRSVLFITDCPKFC